LELCERRNGPNKSRTGFKPLFTTHTGKLAWIATLVPPLVNYLWLSGERKVEERFWGVCG